MLNYHISSNDLNKNEKKNFTLKNVNLKWKIFEPLTNSHFSWEYP